LQGRNRFCSSFASSLSHAHSGNLSLSSRLDISLLPNLFNRKRYAFFAFIRLLDRPCSLLVTKLRLAAFIFQVLEFPYLLTFRILQLRGYLKHVVSVEQIHLDRRQGVAYV